MSPRCTFPLVLVFAATSFAQTSQTVRVGPTGTAKVTRLPNFDTRSFNPAIVQPFSTRQKEKENPTTPFLLAPKRSGLPVGGVRPGSEAVVKKRFPGIGATGWLPPDNDMAVGKTKVVLAVNMAFAIHDKTGRLLFQQDGRPFFNDGNNLPVNGDPKVLYDRDSDRFMAIMMQFDGNAETSHMVLAVSDDGDPEGVWYRYRIDTGLSVGGRKYWLDYPGFGASTTDIVFTGNMFGHTGGYAGNLFVVVPKAPLLTGAPTAGTQIHDPQTSTTKIAVNGEGAMNYGVAVRDSASLWVMAIGRDPNGVPEVRRAAVTVPDMEFPQRDVPGPGGTLLDSIDSRPFTLNLRNGRLVTCHNNRSGAAATARWYQLEHRGFPASGQVPALIQAGDVPIGGFATHMPAATINARGDISVLYSATNDQTTADMVVSTRRLADPAGSTGIPTIVGSSDGVYTGGRWGDYFGIQVDPTDENVFWGYAMLGTGGGNWKTEVATWTIEVPPVVFRLLGVSVPAGLGRLVSGNLASLTEADGNGVTVASVANKAAGNVATLDYSFRFGTAEKPYLRSEVKVLPVTGGRVILSVFDAVRARYVEIASGPADGSTLGFTLSERVARRSVGSNGNATMRITVSVPGRTSVPATVDYVKVFPTAG